jgi:hypothetical protein
MSLWQQRRLTPNGTRLIFTNELGMVGVDAIAAA